ncbi:MAG: hypothetical protein PHF86_08055 [Candidatus Nanoarchaeia archaeon]|nr:hypothetical protein [Candidatus Nanoarchaeia archaeon]
MTNKRAQDTGSGVAVLILLITLFMILYILLLPPTERENVLNQTIGEKEGTSNLELKTLLSESPGQLTITSDNNGIHDISAINIFIKSEPITTKLSNNLEISKGAFSSKPQTLTFDVEDLSNLKSAILFFSVNSGKGNLEIWLNDNIIFDKNVNGVQTIELPTNYIRKNNVLELKVSNPGILFFLKNRYELETIGIKKTYQLINPKETRSFSVTSLEKITLQKVILEYQIYCNKLDKGTTDFEILLNDKSVISKAITCIGGSEKVELPIEYINNGNNILTFSIGAGDFQFSQIKVGMESEEKLQPTYHFEINNNEYLDIVNGNMDITLKLKLPETENKKATIYINDKQFIMETNKNEFLKDIKDYINEGDNFIKIVPRNDLRIDLLEVKLQ